MSDNTIPPDMAIPLSHPWCPLGRPYPESYTAALAQDPNLCVTLDPCSGDGVTTLWTLQPCEAPTTTATVAVADPPVLPRTGLDISEGQFGLVTILVGVALVACSRKKARP